MKYYHNKRIVRRRDYIIIALIWLLAIAVAINVWQYVIHSTEIDRANRAVFEVCEYTRTTDATEQACGIAQDAAHMEYLCDHANALPTNHCWVETK